MMKYNRCDRLLQVLLAALLVMAMCPAQAETDSASPYRIVLTVPGGWTNNNTAVIKVSVTDREHLGWHSVVYRMNDKSWIDCQELFEQEPWKTEVQKGDMAAKAKPLLDEWKKAGGTVPNKLGQGKIIGKDTGKGGSSVGQETEGFHPEHAYKINITANLTPDWFQKNYKGGLINKMIMGIKTGAMSQLSPDSKNPMKDHKYVQNEMLP